MSNTRTTGSAGSESVVIGLDSSTQSTKSIAWDSQGRILSEGRANIPMDNPGLGRFEQDPLDWWSACKTAIHECINQLPENIEVQGLAISNQRETIGFFDAEGKSIAPAIVWIDERARDEVEHLVNTLGADFIHETTGRPPDVTPCLYTLSWMQKYQPELYQRCAHFVDVQSYLVQKLCDGPYRTGWISADPMGMFDLKRKSWSTPILKQLELSPNKLPDVVPPGEQLGEITASAASDTGLPVGLPVFAAGGDGQCAGLGTNCTVPDRAYINLGTAVVSGIWSAEYLCDRAWRTELAAQGNGYIFENCLRSGAFLLNWFVEKFGLDTSDETIFSQLEQEATLIPIGSDGVMVQPYWSGVMDPYWDPSARGVILGLSADHTRAHLYRAILEGITLDQVMSTMDLEKASGQSVTHYVAIGGGANSKLWRQMLADASNKAVQISPTVEASALGAGMIAAFGAGWFDSIEDAAETMSKVSETVHPDSNKAKRYAELLTIYRDLYQSTASINQRLVQFASTSH